MIESVHKFGVRQLIEYQLPRLDLPALVASIDAAQGASGATPRGGALAPGGEPVSPTPFSIQAMPRIRK